MAQPRMFSKEINGRTFIQAAYTPADAVRLRFEGWAELAAELAVELAAEPAEPGSPGSPTDTVTVDAPGGSSGDGAKSGPTEPVPTGSQRKTLRDKGEPEPDDTHRSEPA